jgi:RimJ/RimL family protein N-acetyltransferase
MTAFLSTLSSTYTYRDSSVVNFYVDENEALSVTIDTENLHMRSAIVEDCDSYVKLFGDPDVMGKFANCETKTKEETETRIKNVWNKRWNQNDPYNGLAVFKKFTDEFIGHVVLGHGDAPGQSELAYLFMKNHWGKGYGTEAAMAVVKDYAHATVEEGYTLEGKTLETITATARPDNPGSVRILEKIGMHKIGEAEKFNALRYHFSINMCELSMKV